MTLDKLTTGHGYEFLADHIAASTAEKHCHTMLDNTEKEQPCEHWAGHRRESWRAAHAGRPTAARGVLHCRRGDIDVISRPPRTR